MRQVLALPVDRRAIAEVAARTVVFEDLATGKAVAQPAWAEIFQILLQMVRDTCILDLLLLLLCYFIITILSLFCYYCCLLAYALCPILMYKCELRINYVSCEKDVQIGIEWFRGGHN